MSDAPACYRCRRAEAVTIAAPHWPAGAVVKRYVAESSLPPSVTAAQLWAALDRSAALWSAACNVTFGRAATAAEAQTLVYFGPIDGPWNILAETELPDGLATDHHRMELDAAEAWTAELLDDVVLHETGHEIGLGHAPDDVTAVMRAILQPGLVLQSWDTGQAVALYGPPAPGPTETIDVPPIIVSLSVPEAGTYRVAYASPDGSSLTAQFTAAAPGPCSVTFAPTSAKRIA